LIPRYTRAEMGRIWSEENRFRTWLAVEVAATETLAKAGLVPKDAARAIREKADFSLERIHAIEAEVRHDVIAFTTAVAEIVGPEARWFHYGLTSNDVVDTAQAVLIGQASRIILQDLRNLIEVLERRAFEFKDTPMVGRTHGVHAEPITFGLKLANWYDEAQRDLERFQRAAEEMRVGKFSGAVGNFAHLNPELEEKICVRLGLKAAPITSQVIQRDLHAHYMATLAVVACTLDKIATEIRHLQRTEVREAEEYFSEKQKGSSAMCAPTPRRLLRTWLFGTSAISHTLLWSASFCPIPPPCSITCWPRPPTWWTRCLSIRNACGRTWKAQAGWCSAGNFCSTWWSAAFPAKMPTAWCSATPCAPGRRTRTSANWC
jgi:adenylosuccinate lyase